VPNGAEKEPGLQTDVLIVGAGPVGLALAIELGLQGRHCIVVERNDRVGHAPRAKTTNVRTRELLRRWGLADKLAAASPFGLDHPADVVFATRLAGLELARFHNAFHGTPGRDPRFPEHAQWIPQYTVEEVLRQHAASLPGVELRFQHQLEAFTDDGSSVQAHVTNLAIGKTESIRARFLVGADGARSTVRERLGIAMEGISPLGKYYNIVFRSPALHTRHRLGRAIMYWLINPEVPAVMGPLDRGDRWTFGCEKLADGLADPVQLIRAATGIADLDVEILSRDEWVAHQLMAQRYRVGSVFLAGDACHLHPPFGGYGMNMGIGDAVDLGWKLSALLSGWGGPALAASYELERRQVHKCIVDEAVLNHQAGSRQFAAQDIEDPGAQGAATRALTSAGILASKRREFDSLGIVLGSCYAESPLLVPDGTPAQAVEALSFTPSARPGCRAPHAWVGPGQSQGASLFDLFNRQGFTLLATRGGTEAAKPAAQAARLRGLPLQIVAPGIPGLHDLYAADYALIRPDQFIAWRGDRIDAACAALDTVAGHCAPTGRDFSIATLEST
jgi:2-polyprenyl-6-methoxyphenol hydroxylase-like FAD-dependent oxidoreductase